MPKNIPESSCHCAGHRVILIFGKQNDPTIRAALSWALAQTGVQHKVWYTSTGGDLPKLPRAGGGWANVRRPNGTTGKTADLGRQIDDCCFFEEILVMSHGTHPGLNGFLSRTLRGLLQTRPVRKFTIWTCDTATDIYPNAHSMGRHFERICGLLVPKPCPCGCKLSLCDGRCHHPDGGPRPGYYCPSAEEKTTLYLAAWQDVPAGGQTRSIAAKLGIDPSAAGGQVLTSPDGRVRRVTIAADGSSTTTLETGAEVFGGLRVRADPGLAPADPANEPAINASWRQTDTQAKLPASVPAYTGPIAAACDARREGCLPGP